MPVRPVMREQAADPFGPSAVRPISRSAHQPLGPSVVRPITRPAGPLPVIG